MEKLIKTVSRLREELALVRRVSDQPVGGFREMRENGVLAAFTYATYVVLSLILLAAGLPSDSNLKSALFFGFDLCSMLKFLAVVVRIGSVFAASVSCPPHPCPQDTAFFPLDCWSWVIQTLPPLVYRKRVGLPVGHPRTTDMPLEPVCGNHQSALYLVSRHSFSHGDTQADNLLPYSLLSLVATPMIKMTRAFLWRKDSLTVSIVCLVSATVGVGRE
jgi:hypothetical protein